MGFVFKSVNASPDMGADLKELRERLGWSRDEVAAKTKIPSFLIRTLEEGSWEEIPDPLYAERIVRAYVQFLGGNERYFLEKYRSRLKTKNVKRTLEDLLPRTRKIARLDLTVTSRIIALGSSLLLALLLGGYVFYQARTINTPPPLTISEPTDGQGLSEPFVHIKGKTLPESAVTANGQAIVVQADGSFEGQFDVPRGTTLIVIEAHRRHGDSARVIRRVVFDKPLPNLETLPNTTSTTSTTP